MNLNNMKSITEYIINEKLSHEQQKELLSLVDDSNFNNIIDLIKKHLYKKKINTDKYNEFFKNHGISQLNWGRRNDAVKAFVNLFDEHNNLLALEHIIKNNGVVSVNDLPKIGNIYNYCKVNVDGKEVSFKTEAQEIATWVNGQSAAAGPAEMLLKFLLYEGSTGKSGDVWIKQDGGKEMEVKATTIGSKTPSGGHAAGQKGTIRKTWSLYYFLDKYLFNIDVTNSKADNKQYFQNNNGCSKFIDLCKEKDIETIAECLVDAICFQYDFISNSIIEKTDNENYKNIVKANTVPNRNNIIEETIKLLKDGLTYDNIKNIVGVIQLYLYSIVEDFKFFVGILVAKEDVEKHSTMEGNYILFKCPDNSNSDLLNFKDVLKYIKFGQLDSATSSQGRTGKIYLNIKYSND